MTEEEKLMIAKKRSHEKLMKNAFERFTVLE